jgi:hypothetical protein
MTFKVTVRKDNVGIRDYEALKRALEDRGIDYKTNCFTFECIKFEANKKLLKELKLWDQSYNPSLYI